MLEINADRLGSSPGRAICRSSDRCAVAVAVRTPTPTPQMNRASSSPGTAGQIRKIAADSASASTASSATRRRPSQSLT